MSKAFPPTSKGARQDRDREEVSNGASESVWTGLQLIDGCVGEEGWGDAAKECRPFDEGPKERIPFNLPTTSTQRPRKQLVRKPGAFPFQRARRELNPSRVRGRDAPIKCCTLA